jgi:hypothetical protein
MTHFIQVSVVPGPPGGGAARVNINAIAFYAAWRPARRSRCSVAWSHSSSESYLMASIE